MCMIRMQQLRSWSYSLLLLITSCNCIVALTHSDLNSGNLQLSYTKQTVINPAWALLGRERRKGTKTDQKGRKWTKKGTSKLTLIFCVGGKTGCGWHGGNGHTHTTTQYCWVVEGDTFITSYHKDESFWQSLSTKHRTKSLTHQTGNYTLTVVVQHTRTTRLLVLL